MELLNDTGGRPAKIINNEQIAEIEELSALLNKAQLAEYFGMTEKTFRAIEERQPEVFTAYRRGRANKIAQVASQLMKAVNRGDMRAIQFFLKTQAGWTEKSHVELSRAEEPVDTQWTVKVMGASTCPSCGVDHAK